MLINSPNISGSLTVTGNAVITGSLTVAGGINATITGSATSASYVEYSNVANKPALVSGSSQVTYSGLTGVPSGIVSGSSQITYSGISSIPSGIVSGSSQVTYSGLTGVPSGIVSSSAQVGGYGIFATTGSNQFNGSQAVTGSLTVTGQVVAQTLNVQQVTSSIVYSSGSNIFGNSLGNTQQFTGSVSVTGSLTSNGALSGTNATFTGTALLGGATATNPLSIRTANGESYLRFLNADGSSYGDLERSITGAGAVRFTGANFRFTAGAEVVGALTGSIATFSSTVAIGGATTVGKLDVKTATANIPALGTLGNGFNMVRADGLLGMSIGWENAVGSWYWQGQRTDSAVALNLALQPLGGNVGIGTASPVNKLDVVTSSAAEVMMALKNGTQNLTFGVNNTVSGSFIFEASNAALRFGTNDIERMRITSGGAIQMSNNATTFSIGSIAGVQRIQYGTGGFTTEFAFLQPNDGYTPIGASAFNTRSDYRLKEDLKEFNGLSLVTNMKVYDFKWKENEERNYGFMAHELQEVVPYVVSGTKDGIFEGEPQYQGMDASKLVPVLVKSIQEQQSQIETLKSKIEILEQS